MGRRRALVVVGPAVAAIAMAWSSLETTPTRWQIAAAALVAPALALPARAWARIVLAAGGAVALACLTTRSWPLDAGGSLRTGLDDAALAVAPYDGSAQPALHDLVVLGAFTGAAVAVLAARGGRPLLVAAATAVAVGWPATLAADRLEAFGFLAAVAALWALAATRSRETRRTALAGALVAALGLASTVVATALFQPNAEAAVWRGWDPLGSTRTAVDVRYVWESSYTGISFPARATVLLRVHTQDRPLYWRATTLDVFDDHRWLEGLTLAGAVAPDGRLPPDPLLPPAAGDASQWVEQDVEVVGLRDGHLVAASQPRRVELGTPGALVAQSGGVVRLPTALAPGDRYRVWSYVPRPTPDQLLRSPARYPASLGRYLGFGRAELPPFGERGRARTVAALFRDDRYQQLWGYAPLWRTARTLTARTGSPYQAALAVEAWLRGPSFRYEEQPPPPAAGVPPLVDFALRSRAGYCQHFAGTMALVLRMLGIPSRVAVGFTSGRWSNGGWVVTDHDAHAWVEAWFAGYGWLPFDPTPGRGTLSAAYTLASDSADAVRELGTGRFLRGRSEPLPAAVGAQAPLTARQATSSRPWWLLAVPLAGALLAVAVVGAKQARRRRRLRARDPRALASGIRLELVDTLRDHRLPLERATSVTELARVLETSLRIPAPSLVEALRVARFGPPERADEAGLAARSELQQVLRALRARVGVGRSLRAALALRSLRRS